MARKFLLLLWSLLCILPVCAQDLDGGLLPVTEAYKLSASIPSPGIIELHWIIAPHYYLYRGRMKFLPGDGVALGQANLPAGYRHQDEYLGEVETYHDAIDASVPYSVTKGFARLKFSVQYQGCHEVDPKTCYPPYTQAFDLPLPGAQSSTAVQASHGDAVPPQGGRTAEAAPDRPSGHLTSGILSALLLSFAGGLILNLMPCVLPVLSLKAVGLLESGDDRARAKRHALLYTAGALSSFAVTGSVILSLRTAGNALGWGTQLQHPLVIALLACLMLALGLSMSGVVQFGASLGNVGGALAARSSAAGDFFTGVLAVVVASPCTAPFMGTALAYAFAAPAISALLVFLALGMGLSLPMLVIGFIPAFARALPRPGRWMETLKQVLAYPMYLTAAWLVWVLAHQRGPDAVGLVLVSMVLLAMTLWCFELGRTRGPVSRASAAILVLLAVWPLYLLAQLPPPASPSASEEGAVGYTPAKLAQLRRSGTPVFVDMTADWCITCKANEHAVLDTDAFRGLLKHTGTIYMKGDWTDVDPTIGAFLQEYRSPGVPLYVVFPRNGGNGRKLPNVLTPTIVEQAIAEASAP